MTSGGGSSFGALPTNLAAAIESAAYGGASMQTGRHWVKLSSLWAAPQAFAPATGPLESATLGQGACGEHCHRLA